MRIMKKNQALAGVVDSMLSVLFWSLVLPGCAPQYDSRDIPQPETGGLPSDSLKGTVWVWDSPWGRRTLTFHQSDMTVVYLGQDGDSYTEPYTYNGNTKTGTIQYYGEEGFEISSDNQSIHFIEWKQYGHGCDFTRLNE